MCSEAVHSVTGSRKAAVIKTVDQATFI